MFNLYSHGGSYPAPIPFRIKLSDGRTRTDPSTFTDDEIADAGYVMVPAPPPYGSDQMLEWDSESVAWVVRSKTEQELQAESDQRRSQVNGVRDERIARGFGFQDNIYDSKPEDQKRISGATQMAFMAVVNGAQPGDYLWAGTAPFGWIAMDNSLVPMDAPTVIEFGKTAAEWERVHIFAARNLKDMATVPEDFRSDVWWPPVQDQVE